MIRKIIILLTALIIFSAQQSMAQLNNHANIEKNSAISLNVSSNSIDLSASDNDKLQSCKGYIELRVAGTEKWSEDFSTKIEVIEKKASGIKIRYVFRDALVDAAINKIEGNKLEFSGTIKNTSSSTIQLARFHYLDGTIKDTASLFLGMSGKLVNSKDEILPLRPETEKIWSGLNVFWPRLQEPISDQKNWAVSTDVGFLLRGWRSKGWLIGYFGPGVAFGEIGFRTKTIEPRFFSAVLLDNIVMEPNETRVLEKFIVAYGDWQNNLNDWVVKCAQ